MESEQRMGTAYRRASSKFSNRPGEICRDSYMGLLYWSHEPGATRAATSIWQRAREKTLPRAQREFSTIQQRLAWEKQRATVREACVWVVWWSLHNEKEGTTLRNQETSTCNGKSMYITHRSINVRWRTRRRGLIWGGAWFILFEQVWPWVRQCYRQR